MKEKRYILNSVYKMQYDNDIELIAYMSGDNVRDKELFFDPEEKYTTKVYDKDWEFNYLEPTHYDEFDDIKFICDFHLWTKSSPSRIITFPISFFRVSNLLTKLFIAVTSDIIYLFLFSNF